MRFTAAGILFIPFMKWPGVRKAAIIFMIGILMGPLHQGFLYIGLTKLPAGLMSVLLQSNVIMVTLIGWLFMKETVGWRTWLGISTGIVGVVILTDLSDNDIQPIGYAYAFLSAFFIAITYIAMKKLDTTHPPTYIALMSLPVAPFLFIGSYFIEGTTWIDNIDNIDWNTVGIVVLYQAIILSFSHMIWQNLMVKIPVSQIVPWTLLIPIFAIITAAIILNEEITRDIIIGTILTIIGVGIITIRKIQKNIPIDAESVD